MEQDQGICLGMTALHGIHAGPYSRAGGYLAYAARVEHASAKARRHTAHSFNTSHPRQAAVALLQVQFVASWPLMPNKSFKPMPLRGTA